MKENLCVIGCGQIFELYHLDAILQSQRFKIKYVLDTDVKIVNFFAKKLNCIGINDYSEIKNTKTFFVTAPPKYRLEIFEKIKDIAKTTP